MAFFLIKIRKNRWNQSNLPRWLREGDFPAPPLTDFRVDESGRLSVWHIEDDKSNLQQVATALAANSDGLSNLDYAMFEQCVVESLEMRFTESVGKTPHGAANQWHRDFVEVSANRLLALTKCIFARAIRERIPEWEVRTYIKTAVEDGHIQEKKLKPGIQEKLGDI